MKIDSNSKVIISSSSRHRIFIALEGNGSININEKPNKLTLYDIFLIERGKEFTVEGKVKIYGVY